MPEQTSINLTAAAQCQMVFDSVSALFGWGSRVLTEGQQQPVVASRMDFGIRCSRLHCLVDVADFRMGGRLTAALDEPEILDMSGYDSGYRVEAFNC
jgi:hypothetical protein